MATNAFSEYSRLPTTGSALQERRDIMSIP